MGFSCLECMKRFSQVVLIITNICVAVFGLLVMIIGIWANVDGKNYVEITDVSAYTQVSVLCIIVGLFVLILGIIGAIGGIFASTVFGRITLGLYAVILTLLVICEIAAGIAAAVKRDDVETAFNKSANNTFKFYLNESKDAWDSFQKTFKCCGVSHPSDYVTILNITVPASCCKNPSDNTTCQAERKNPNSSELYQEGCATVLTDAFRHSLGAIAGGVIVLGLFQVFGIVMACFVALYRTKEKYEVV